MDEIYEYAKRKPWNIKNTPMPKQRFTFNPKATNRRIPDYA
jgi:hypothetical protein